MTRGLSRWPGILVSLALLFTLPGCHPDQPVAGSYRAMNPSEASSPAELKLEADGKGSWKVGQDTAPFRWEVRGSQIWLHYRTGGVVTGIVYPDKTIDILVPGVGPFHFEAVK